MIASESVTRACRTVTTNKKSRSENIADRDKNRYHWALIARLKSPGMRAFSFARSLARYIEQTARARAARK